MSEAAPGPDDVPFPLLEKGDFVRLKEPYRPSSDVYLREKKEIFEALVRARSVQRDDDFHESKYLQMRTMMEREGYQDLFSYTHGTVVEIVSRYPPRQAASQAADVVMFEDTGGGPPRNVSLHLYNPATGLMYVFNHPTEPGAPMFVDQHINELVLIHKHDESWGNEYEVDLADVYAEWGIEDIGIPLEEADGND